MALISLNSENTCYLTDVPALIYNRKTAAGRFDLINDFLRSLGLALSLLKDRNAPIWSIGNQGVNKWLVIEKVHENASDKLSMQSWLLLRVLRLLFWYL